MRKTKRTKRWPCCSVPCLTVMIALADFLAPANYNLAIFYMVPLFLCAGRAAGGCYGACWP